jgi:sphingomyelin phosphodiesterase 4
MRKALHTMNMNKYFKSTPNRYSEFAEFIDKSAVKELEIFFPKLVSEIFNSDCKVNWGLRTRKADTNYAEFNEIFNFLQPNGPMFRLCYKLSLDCHFRHEFPYQCLPVSI